MIQSICLTLLSVFVGLPLATSYMLQSRIITVNAGGDLQAAINSAQPSDIIELQAGATWDAAQPIVLANKASNAPVTIRSSSYASLSTGRISPADTSKMARIRDLGNGVFIDASGGSYWILDGLEVTDNITSGHSHSLFRLTNGGKTKISRSYIHPKESNPDWTRHVSWGIQYEGAAGLTVENSNISGLLGFYNNTAELIDTRALISVGGKNVTLTNNFLGAWYATIFTGGGSFSEPTHTAQFTGTPTMNQATLTTTEGLQVGMVVRVDLLGTGTKTGTTFTRTGGTVLSNADVKGQFGTGFTFGGYPFSLTAVAGNVLGLNLPPGIPDGNYDWTMWEAIQIDSVSGNTITYHPVGANPLTQAPSAAHARLAWTVGDGSNNSNWTITRNTFRQDTEFIAHLRSLGRADDHGKGYWEMKHMKRLVVDGNSFQGFPNQLAFATFNQTGSEPWSTTEDLTITNNLFEPDPGMPIGGAPIILYFIDPYRSNTAGKNVVIVNNQVRGYESLLYTGGGASSIQLYHNTIINTGSTASGYHSVVTSSGLPISGWVFRDNLSSYRTYGAQCASGSGLAGCWPGGIWRNNAIIDTERAGVNESTLGAGGILSPVLSSFTQAGFVNFGSNDYRDYALTSTSPFKNRGSDGTDPGVNVAQLEAALGGTGPVPTPLPSATPTPSPIISPLPSPNPTGSVNINGYVRVNDVRTGGITVAVKTTTGALITSTVSRTPDGYFEFVSVPVGSLLAAGPMEQQITGGGAYFFNLPAPSPSATPSPTPPQPSPTATPAPTATPIPSPTVSPTPRPSPSPTSPCTISGKCKVVDWPRPTQNPEAWWAEITRDGWKCEPYTENGRTVKAFCQRP